MENRHLNRIIVTLDGMAAALCDYCWHLNFKSGTQIEFIALMRDYRHYTLKNRHVKGAFWHLSF